MKQPKNLNFSLILAIIAFAALPASAQVRFELSSQKTFRQTQKGSVAFKNGSFRTKLTDGSVESIFFCNDPNYFPPGFYRGLCSPGTSGFLSSGNINGATIQRPYLVITALQEAIVIQGGASDLVRLTAAPASLLPRPAGGFTDDSSTVFYNLNSTSIREYNITSYFTDRNYNRKQLRKFDREIVSGVYHYSFPRLGVPDRVVGLSAVIYPMPEGLKKLNKRKVGVTFIKGKENRWNNKFLELNYHRPNEIRWKGMTQSETFAAVDKLYFSMRILQNPRDPNNTELVARDAVFPQFDNNEDARVLLANPYVTSFTVPPIFPSGTRAMVELELQRDFPTGAVTIDRSNRKFQIPVIVIDRYKDYRKTNLGGLAGAILADGDGDGANNLTEWILDSNPADASSLPVPPLPAPFQAVTIVGTPTQIGSYFGFNVNVKAGTVPRVRYLLQRSMDDGQTWSTFLSDDNWTVDRVSTTIRGITTEQIQVRSLFPNPNEASPMPFVQPPTTFGHLYRVKITLQ